MEAWSESLYNALLLFTILNLTDIITTFTALKKYGVEREANPIARFIARKLGVAGLFILKYLGMAAVILVGFITSGFYGLELSLWLDNIILAGVTAWNSTQIYLARRRENQ